jgi:hypothetical protein
MKFSRSSLHVRELFKVHKYRHGPVAQAEKNKHASQEIRVKRYLKRNLIQNNEL